MYFLLMVDDRTKYMWMVMLKTKDGAAAAIKEVRNRAQAKSGLKLGTLQIDRGGEFTAAVFAEYCVEEGVCRHLTAPYSPQQNDVVECRNGTVVATTRSMLMEKGLPG